ncbi:hypothetical protein JOB18_009615 [Solea senegalensis]|uniref:Uncharacterized protein n=1 Tax=Solea senegalensis TaxID=28829 RepID=A0AAV6QWD2_SOLSE|nr:hypothetical protein JOB18_009615 [Solea senegalensis]
MTVQAVTSPRHTKRTLLRGLPSRILPYSRVQMGSRETTVLVKVNAIWKTNGIMLKHSGNNDMCWILFARLKLQKKTYLILMHIPIRHLGISRHDQNLLVLVCFFQNSDKINFYEGLRVSGIIIPRTSTMDFRHNQNRSKTGLPETSNRLSLMQHTEASFSGDVINDHWEMFALPLKQANVMHTHHHFQKLPNSGTWAVQT